MADQNQIKNAIVLEGEAEYKKSLDNINRALRESKSAMKAAAAEYDGASDSMVAMYREGDALERHLKNQEEALRLMGEQLVKVEGAYGRNSREAQELRTRINNMRTEMAKTQSEIRQFESRMEQVADTSQDMNEQLEGSSDTFTEVGEKARSAADDVEELSQKITDMVGEKMIEFTVGAFALDKLKDALKEAVTWALGEGVDGIYDRNHTMAVTNTDAETSEMLNRVGDAVKRKFAAYISDDEAIGLTADLWTGMGIGGRTPTEAEMTNLAPQIYGVSQAKGISTTDIINSAQTLMTEFNETWQHSVDLLDLLGAATVGHTQEAISAMGTYSEVFKAAGYDADDMFTIMINGAQEFGVEKLGDLGKNLATFEKNLTSGSKEVTEALKAMGIEATDLPYKFQQGGETAEEAFKLVLQTLLSIEDKAKQADLAKAFFGDMNWTKNGADIAQLFLDGFDSTINADGQAERTAQAWADTFENNWAGTMERAGQSVGEITQPIAEAANDALKVLNDNIDAAEGSLLVGVGDTFLQANEQMAEKAAAAVDPLFKAAEEKLTQADQAYDSWAQEFAVGAAESIGAALGGAWESTKTWFKSFFTDSKDETQQAAQDIGESAVTGYEDGAEGMEDAAGDTVDGAVYELYKGVGRAYDAGYAMGQAFERGYNNALDRHSPSRVMRGAAKDTTSPLFDQFEEDEMRLQEAGAALGAAFAGGYGNGSAGGYGALTGGPGASGASVPVLAAAVREALVGLAWDIDGHTVAELVEPGVSQATTQRAVATVRGQSAMSKRW